MEKVAWLFGRLVGWLFGWLVGRSVTLFYVVFFQHNSVQKLLLSSPHLLKVFIGDQLQAGRELGMERDLVHPVLHLTFCCRQEQEFRAVGTAKPANNQTQVKSVHQ